MRATEEPHHQLQGLADQMKPSTDGQAIQQLRRAFDLFSKETQRLEAAYQSLQGDVRQINAELSQKVRELDCLSDYLDSILGHIRQGLLFVSTQGTISTYNRAAEGILGFPSHAVLLRNFWEIFADDTFGFSMRDSLMKREAPDTINVSTSDRELEIQATYVREGQGYLEGIILLIRDITELQRLKKLAEQNDRLKDLGEMAARVAHEIRNPLGGIEGFAGLLRRDLAEDLQRKNMAEQILEGAHIIDRLITNILNYSRPVFLQAEPCDLREICEAAIEIIRIQHPHPIELKGRVPRLILDPALIRNALLNLLTNAVQASPNQEPIQVTLSESSKEVKLHIRDHGCGIPESDLPKIFSPFFSSKHDGNGFGLSEVYKTLQAHGGRIEAESQQGQGSTFTLYLPKRGNKHVH